MAQNKVYMRALVTGATGFIGSHLVEELLKKGYRVACLARKSSSLRWIEGLDVSVRYGDCLEPESLRDAVADADVIFHLAGLTKAPRAKDFFSVNVEGARNILQAASGSPGLRRFVHLSSLAAVGPSTKEAPVNEETEPAPVSDYGKSKLEGERAVLSFGGKVPFTIIRPPAVYGPRDKDFNVLYRMLMKGIFPDWGESQYSLLYVDDLVRGLIQAAESPAAEGNVYFLADGEVHTNADIAGAISEALGKNFLRLRLPRGIVPLVAGLGGRLGKQGGILRDRARELKHPRWTCSAIKAGEAFGFQPKTGLAEGVKWTANWYRIHQWL